MLPLPEDVRYLTVSPRWIDPRLAPDRAPAAGRGAAADPQVPQTAVAPPTSTTPTTGATGPAGTTAPATRPAGGAAPAPPAQAPPLWRQHSHDFRSDRLQPTTPTPTGGTAAGRRRSLGAAARPPHRLPLRALPALAPGDRHAGLVARYGQGQRPSRPRALTQQVERLTCPAKRGTIIDRHGNELAVSEDASTIYANPLLIKDPGATATRLAPLLQLPHERAAARSSPTAQGLRLPAGARSNWTSGAEVAKLKIEGIGTLVEPRSAATRRHGSHRR